MGNTILTLDKNGYTGTFQVIPNANTFTIIERTPLENYLYGVLPHEMHHTWALEALKAQAVAARTYTLKSIENKSEEPFDLYNDVRSQVYRGSAQVYDSVKKAVDQTRGQVLSYKGELFYTYYHGNCGGGTDHVSIWNEKAPHIKPLAGASCKFDSHSQSFNFKQDIAKSLAEKYENFQKNFYRPSQFTDLKNQRRLQASTLCGLPHCYRDAQLQNYKNYRRHYQNARGRPRLWAWNRHVPRRGPRHGQTKLQL